MQRGHRHGQVRLGLKLRLGIGVALVSLLLAACSSSTTRNTTSNGTSSGTSSAGKPIKIGAIIDLSGNGGTQTSFYHAFQSAVKAVNMEHHGVHGDPVDVITCDSQSSDAAAAACGRTLAGDHVVGVVVLAATEDTFMPYLERAGIPTINLGGFQSLYNSPTSFITNDTQHVGTYGYVLIAAKSGCQSVATVKFSQGSLDESYVSSAQKAASLYHTQWKGVVIVPTSAVDVTPYINQGVAKGAQCLITTFIGPQMVSALNAEVPLVKEGRIGKVVVCTGCLAVPGLQQAETQAIKAIGPDKAIQDGAVASLLETSNPVIKRWVHDESAYNPDKTPSLIASTAAEWVNFQLLIHAANAVYPNVTASSVLNYLNHLQNWWPGLYPAVSFVKAPANPFGPRDFGGWVANYGWTETGTDLPRTSPFYSLLDGSTDNNAVPAGFDLDANFE